jgi:sulfoxide reductase heme-binding subunit YedZ
VVLSRLDRYLKTPVASVSLFMVCTLPIIGLVFGLYSGGLGADPAKVIVKEFGFWAAVILWVSLLASTLARRSGLTFLLRRRRMLGLFAFFYGVLHLLSYLAFMLGWRWGLIGSELTKRPYIVVGLIALLLLIPLALTSTKWAQKKMGRAWRLLHRLVYPAAALVLVHIIWMVRASYLDALLFTVCLLLLFMERFEDSRKKRK